MTTNWNIQDFITIIELMIKTSHKEDLTDLCDIHCELKGIVKAKQDATKRKECAKGAISTIAYLLSNTKGLSYAEKCLLEKMAVYLNSI